MNRREIARKVLARVSQTAPDELREDMELVADLGIDSPKALELLVELEDALGIEISDESAAKMESVGDVLAFAGSAS